MVHKISCSARIANGIIFTYMDRTPVGDNEDANIITVEMVDVAVAVDDDAKGPDEEQFDCVATSTVMVMTHQPSSEDKTRQRQQQR